MPLTILEMALIALSIRPLLFTFSCNLVIVPLPLINVSGLKNLLSISMFFIVFPLSDVVVACLGTHKVPIPVGHVIAPPTLEYGPIVDDKDALAVANVLDLDALADVHLILIHIHRGVLQFVPDHHGLMLITIIKTRCFLYQVLNITPVFSVNIQ